MKTIFRFVWALVVAASAFVACSKDDSQNTNVTREVEMTVVTASDLDTSAPQSRTGFDPATGAVYWNQAGEYLKVFETAGTKTTAKDSAEGVVTDNGTKASFGVSFPENTAATAFTYNAIYPASAWVSGNDNTDVAKLKVITPDTQSPAETSFDPAADLLIALPVTSGIQPSELDMRFKRMVAVGKMTIKALASSDPITSIVFTAPGKKVTGRSYLNLSEGTAVEYGYQGQSNDNLTLTFASDRNFTTGNQTYFTCFPFELAAGDKFSVTIKAGNKTFTKEVTLGEGRSLAFVAGASSTFTVNMSGIEGVETKTLDGDYVIVAKQNDVYYAMSSEAEKARLAAKTIEYDGVSEKFATTDATIIWKIAKDGDNYTIRNAEKYLSWQGGTTNGATTGDSSYALSITPNDDGTYKIGSVDNPQRILAKNNDSTLGFAFYTGSQTKDLLLIKVGEDTRTQLAAPLNLMADATGNIVEVVWDAVEGAENYTVTCGDQSQTVTRTDAEFTMEYGQTYTVSVVANPTDTENYKSSEAATVEVTTGENPNPGQAIGELKAGDTGVIVKGATVAAVSTNGFIMQDATGAIFVYKPSTQPAFGSTVNVSGDVASYNKGLQFSAGATVETTGTTEVTAPEATVVSAENITGLMTVDAVVATYVKIIGTLNISGSYYNITFPFDTAYQGSIYYPNATELNLAAYDQQTVEAEGWFFSISNQSGAPKFLNFIATKVVPDTSTPHISITKAPTQFSVDGGAQTVEFTALNLNGNQVFAKIEGEGAGQFTAGTIGEGSIEITAKENTETVAKNATLTLYIAATEGGAALASAEVTLSQAAKSEGGETGGGTDDFSTLSVNSSYSTRRTTAGWVGENCAVTKFDNSIGMTINGKTTAKGTITSPILTGGCGVLSLNYVYTFSESKGVDFKIEIKQNGAVVKTFDVKNTSAVQNTSYTFSETVGISGDFQIVITNNSPSNNSKSNKDRYTIFNISWTGNN